VAKSTITARVRIQKSKDVVILKCYVVVFINGARSRRSYLDTRSVHAVCDRIDLVVPILMIAVERIDCVIKAIVCAQMMSLWEMH